jgi:autonomous glycyl radical cofactor GrcA
MECDDSDSNVQTEECVICRKPLGETEIVTLRERGANGINEASLAKGSSLRVEAGQTVHIECRRKYTKHKSTASSGPSVSKSARLSGRKFVFKDHCLFCGNTVQGDGQKRGTDMYPVRTKDFQTTIVEDCKKRNFDEWSQMVLGRIEFAQDLHAADACYHQTCSVNFRTGKQIPQQQLPSESSSKRLKPGRPTITEKVHAFHKVIEYIEENDDEVITLTDLVTKMEFYLKSLGSAQQPYSVVYMKGKLLNILVIGLPFLTYMERPMYYLFESLQLISFMISTKKVMLVILKGKS